MEDAFLVGRTICVAALSMVILSSCSLIYVKPEIQPRCHCIRRPVIPGRHLLLNGLAVKAYDGDTVALTRLIGAAESKNPKLAWEAQLILSKSANPRTAPFLTRVLSETQNDDVRSAISRSLRDTLDEAAVDAPEDGIKWSMKSEVVPDDDHRDSLLAEFLQTADLAEKGKLAWRLSRMADERLLPYLDELRDQRGMSREKRDISGCTRVMLELIWRISISENRYLPSDQRQEIYERVLSAVLADESLLCDLSGRLVKLKLPHTQEMSRSRRVYAVNTCLKDIEDLRLERFEVQLLPLWKIRRIANRRERLLRHLRLGKIYTNGDYAAMCVTTRPTQSVRHFDLSWSSGERLWVLLRKDNNEWRLHSVL